MDLAFFAQLCHRFGDFLQQILHIGLLFVEDVCHIFGVCAGNVSLAKLEESKSVPQVAPLQVQSKQAADEFITLAPSAPHRIK